MAISTTLTPQEEFERKEARRQAAIDLAKGMPGLIREEAAEQRRLFEEGAEVQREAIRGQAARALAGSLAQAGIGSGAGFAAGRQAAIETGEAIGEVDASLARDIATLSGARQEAAQAELAALQFEAEAGTAEEEGRALIESYRPRIAAIIEENRGLVDDDEAAMSREIRALAAKEPNPIAREWLELEALGVKGAGPHARDV